MVTVQRGDHQITRNSSLFKRVGLNVSHKEEEDSGSRSDSEYNSQSQESPEKPTTPPPRRNPQQKRLPPNQTQGLCSIVKNVSTKKDRK